MMRLLFAALLFALVASAIANRGYDAYGGGYGSGSSYGGGYQHGHGMKNYGGGYGHHGYGGHGYGGYGNDMYTKIKTKFGRYSNDDNDLYDEKDLYYNHYQKMANKANYGTQSQFGFGTAPEKDIVGDYQ